MHLPDYSGTGIVNLMRSIELGLGARADARMLPYPALPMLPPERVARARNVVLMVLDGLGHDWLGRHAAGSRIASALRGRLTSVFPSTTATAVTTFLTGLAPLQHGLTGWHLPVPEAGADTTAAILPFRTRAEGRPLRELGIDPLTWFEHDPLFDRLPVRSAVVAPKWIIDSDFNLAHSGAALRCGYDQVYEFFRAIERALATPVDDGQRRYVYAYWPDLDSNAHDHGTDSPEVQTQFARLESAFGPFLSRVAGSDTLLLVTADHGFIDSPPEHVIELDRHPDLAACLARPLCGERRVAYAYVHPGRHREFEDLAAARLGDRVCLRRSAELVTEGWFGRGVAHPRFAARIGDYTLIMRDDWVIKDWLPGERRHHLRGVHGGPSAAEMYVPLCVFEC
jgi:hypothetical protein